MTLGVSQLEDMGTFIVARGTWNLSVHSGTSWDTISEDKGETEWLKNVMFLVNHRGHLSPQVLSIFQDWSSYYPRERNQGVVSVCRSIMPLWPDTCTLYCKPLALPDHRTGAAYPVCLAGAAAASKTISLACVLSVSPPRFGSHDCNLHRYRTQTVDNPHSL